MNHNYKIALADKVDDNVAGMEDEVFSDMLQVAEDFHAWTETTEGFEASNSLNIQKFSDDTHYRVSGIVFPFTISVISRMNKCAKP